MNSGDADGDDWRVYVYGLNEVYWQGYNYYWYGGRYDPYEDGTIEWRYWWTGWETAAQMDRGGEAQDSGSDRGL